jgi:hypothetical protein
MINPDAEMRGAAPIEIQPIEYQDVIVLPTLDLSTHLT